LALARRITREPAFAEEVVQEAFPSPSGGGPAVSGPTPTGSPNPCAAEHAGWNVLAVGWALSTLEPHDEVPFAAHLPRQIAIEGAQSRRRSSPSTP